MSAVQLFISVFIVFVWRSQGFSYGHRGGYGRGCFKSSAWFERKGGVMLRATDNMDLFAGGSDIRSPSIVEEEGFEGSSRDSDGDGEQQSSKTTKMSINLKLMEEELKRTNARREPGLYEPMKKRTYLDANTNTNTNTNDSLNIFFDFLYRGLPPMFLGYSLFMCVIYNYCPPYGLLQ